MDSEIIIPGILFKIAVGNQQITCAAMLIIDWLSIMGTVRSGMNYWLMLRIIGP